jgi:hypothetical protein
MWKWFWLLWFVVSAFILSIYAWSLWILYQQKKAWKAFAKKNDLEYRPGRLTEPPFVTGKYRKHKIFLYTSIQETADVRGQRFVTAIEIELGQGLPVPAALGTKEVGYLIMNLRFNMEYEPDSEHWKNSYVLRTTNTAMLDKYLTKERLETIGKLFAMNSASVLFFFDPVEAVLRIETSDPLRDSTRIEKIIDRILRDVEKLKTSAEEQKEIENAANAAPPPGSVEIELPPLPEETTGSIAPVQVPAPPTTEQGEK